ncbi:sushi domain-containing protein 1-like [Rhinophrynus dorsalis]
MVLARSNCHHPGNNNLIADTGTEARLNISTWREYNKSFTEEESYWINPNVTVYKIKMKYGTNYTVTLRGLTSAGAGDHAVWTHETPIADPPFALKTEIRAGEEAATFHLHPVPDLHGPISCYEIIVVVGQRGNGSDVCGTYITTHYNSSHIPSAYTTILLQAKNLTSARTVTLGDGQYYGGFFNAPLSRDHNYTVYVRVTSRWKQVPSFLPPE